MPKMLYASGVGTTDFAFPAGVAVKLAKGQPININLHLYNTSDAVLTGSSGIAVKTVPASAVTDLAEMFFAGTQQLLIPSNNMPVQQSGGCTAQANYKVFALWPHMHQIATKQKIELTQGNTTRVLLDENYSFGDQKYYPVAAPLAIKAGDKFQVTCTYVNNTGSPVTFGDSSDSEMCFPGMYRYPTVPGGSLLECVR